MNELRPYQLQAMTDLRHAYATGHRAPVLVAGCGWGKSVTAAEVARLSCAKGNRVLVIAHRIELIEQLQNTFDWWGVPDDQCDIMMVQSATRRLQRMPEYDFIICDEAHHSVCSTYQRIYSRYPNAKRLLLTATPRRTNGQGLSDVADCIVSSVSTRWLIEHNYLAPYEYYAPAVMVDADKLRTVRGDYDQSDTVAQLDKPKIYGDVIRHYRKYADGKQTIVFASSVDHSRSVCKVFNDAGISAYHIDGKTPPQERREAMERFKNGELQVITNYEIISEGLSVDGCECCILLRPTKSLILFLQSSQRCMRYALGKTAVILDMVGNYQRHGLPDDDREWTLDGTVKRSRQKEQNTVHARTCEYCFRTYAGAGRVCPYCQHDNGKTRQEIEADERAELERVQAEERKQKRMEVGRAQTREELEKIAKERGYKPGWVWRRMQIIENRRRAL